MSATGRLRLGRARLAATESNADRVPPVRRERGDASGEEGGRYGDNFRETVKIYRVILCATSSSERALEPSFRLPQQSTYLETIVEHPCNYVDAQQFK